MNALGRVFGRNRLRDFSRGIYTWKEARIQADWGEIRGKIWEDEGDRGDKKSILALHGWVDNAGTFDGVAANLPPGFRLFSVEFPGNGFSDRLPARWSYDIFWALPFLKTVKSLLGCEKPILMGFSLGSVFLQIYASILPKEVDRLISLEMVYSRIPPSEERLIFLKNYVLSSIKMEKYRNQGLELDYDEALKQFKESVNAFHGSNAITQDAAKIIMERAIKKTDSGKYVWTTDPLQRALPPMEAPSDMPFLVANSIKCPFLIVKAKDSKYLLSREHVEKYLSIQRSVNPDFEYVEVEGGHYAHINYPERVSPLINDFLLKGKSV